MDRADRENDVPQHPHEPAEPSRKIVNLVSDSDEHERDDQLKDRRNEDDPMLVGDMPDDLTFPERAFDIIHRVRARRAALR